jgi:hypothetical protein
MNGLARLLLILVTGTSLACGERSESCTDAGVAVIGYRNGRVYSFRVSCPSQCPGGTRAMRVECVWDCSRPYFCAPLSDAGAGPECGYSGGRGRNTIGLPGDDPRCSPRD